MANRSTTTSRLSIYQSRSPRLRNPNPLQRVERYRLAEWLQKENWHQSAIKRPIDTTIADMDATRVAAAQGSTWRYWRGAWTA